MAREATEVPVNATSMLSAENNNQDGSSFKSNTDNTTSQQSSSSSSLSGMGGMGGPNSTPSASVGVAGSSQQRHTAEDDANSDEDSDRDETINIDDPFIFTAADNNEAATNFERAETDINEIDWTQTQGITPDSSLAWALDGHIRMRNDVSNRLFAQTGLVSSTMRKSILFYFRR